MTTNDLFQPNLLCIPEIFKEYGQKKTFQSGEILFMKNDPADYLYYIIDGRLRAFLPYPDGSERTLCYFSNNNLAGEEIFATPPIRIVCAGAMTKLHTYRLDAKTLLRACMNDDESMHELLSFFMKKITLLHSWIFYAQFIKNEEKIACLLYSITDENDDKVNLTHEQIAAVTGMSRVTATRVMNNLVEKNMIIQEYKHIRVLDRQKLREIFEGKEFY